MLLPLLLVMVAGGGHDGRPTPSPSSSSENNTTIQQQTNESKRKKHKKPQFIQAPYRGPRAPYPGPQMGTGGPPPPPMGMRPGGPGVPPHGYPGMTRSGMSPGMPPPGMQGPMDRKRSASNDPRSSQQMSKPKKKKKIADKILPQKVRDLVPESQAYMDLLAFERKLDATIMRKRLDIQEALKRPMKQKKKIEDLHIKYFFPGKTRWGGW